MKGTRHDGLVEEIADYLQASYAMGQHDYKLGLGYGKTPRKWDKDKAKKIIVATLKAVVDRELDEELGVVGRGKILDGFMVEWDEEPEGGAMDLSCPFIALSPAGIPVGRKEGTFLEEAVRNLEAHRKRLEEWLDKKEISPTGTGEEE